MLRFGPDHGPVVVVALPLFEEANRLRAFAVTLCRLLAARGVASMLPDLPGQGESLVPPEDCSIREIAGGIAAASKAEGRTLYSVAIRSGALLDKLGLFKGRWHFAPQSGPDLLRDLKRIKQAAIGSSKPLNDLWYLDATASDDGSAPSIEVAGNHISVGLLTELTVAAPWQPSDGSHLRIVRLDTDPRAADRHVPGMALWRRAEPDTDPALAALLADDIAAWIATCEG